VLALALVIPLSPALAAAPQTNVNDVEGEVMCPICGTLLELAESPQAQRERVLVKRLIVEGKTKAEVKDALVAQYGPAVLALPEGAGFDLSAYLVPVIAFVVAAIALAFGVLRWRRAARRREAHRVRTPNDWTPISPATTSEKTSGLDDEAGSRAGETRRRHPLLRPDEGGLGNGHRREQLRDPPGRRTVDYQQLVGAFEARHSMAESPRVEQDRPIARRPTRDYTNQWIARLGRARSRQGDRLQDRRGVRGPAQVLVQPWRSGEAERLGEPRLGELALEQRRADSSGRGRGRQPGCRPSPTRRLSRNQDRADRAQLLQQAAVRV